MRLEREVGTSCAFLVDCRKESGFCSKCNKNPPVGYEQANVMIRLAFLEDHSDHYMEDKRRAFIWKVATNVQGRNDDGLDKVEQRNVQIWRLCR